MSAPSDELSFPKREANRSDDMDTKNDATAIVRYYITGFESQC